MTQRLLDDTRSWANDWTTAERTLSRQREEKNGKKSAMAGNARHRRKPICDVGLLLSVLALAACGGGGGGNEPEPTGPNRFPVVALSNTLQRAVHLHSFRYDPTQGGRTFGDPDGDRLTYQIVIGHTYNPYNDPNPPRGLRVEGTRIVGQPEELGVALVTITAMDGRGGAVSDQFGIRVDPNSNPDVVNANDDRIVPMGGMVDHETSGSGTVFSDPDGDQLTYDVSLRGEPRGLSVAGTRVSGVLDSIGLVEVTITAMDVFGGRKDDVFMITAPAPEPGPPSLPAILYRYEDAALDLPFVFLDPAIDTQPDDNRVTDAGATLGRVLFYDKRLSSTNTVACASCHQQSRGFAAPERFSRGALGVPTRRHAMTLANVRYNLHRAWFADMRVSSLLELVLLPIQNAEELGSALTLVESKVRATDFYPALFEAAFGTPEITSDRIARSLAQFLQALISYRSRYDLAYNPPFNGPGDPASVLTDQELRGADIFRNAGPGRCEVCHETSFLTNGWHANNGLDIVPADPGINNPALQRNGARGVFRAASLRNVGVTAPYMHDGRFATLRDVINHYDHGIQASPDLDFILRDATGDAPMRLNLSEEDKDALEAFLRTLTDHEFLNDPKFSDPFQAQ